MSRRELARLWRENDTRLDALPTPISAMSYHELTQLPGAMLALMGLWRCPHRKGCPGNRCKPRLVGKAARRARGLRVGSPHG